MIYYETDYLMHHGILGQKWGVRRYQNSDGTLTAAGKARYGTREAFEAHQKLKQANKEYSKAFNNAYNHNHPYSLSKKRRLESQKRWDEAADKAEAYRNAKKNYKDAKDSYKKEAVKRYNRAADKADSSQDAADIANQKMKDAYKDLGKTKVSRVIESFKGTIGKGGDAFQRYSKAYDEAIRAQETADADYADMRKAFRETGRNYVDRVYTNIKYDR